MIALVRPFLPHLVIAAGLLFGIWYIQDQGYRRAQREYERRELTQAILVLRAEKRLEAKLQQAIGAIGIDVDTRLTELGAARASVQTILQREIIREPRFSDPAAGITPGMLDALNRAGCASHPPSAPCHRGTVPTRADP